MSTPKAEITRDGEDMAFTKITAEDLKSRGATTLPNQPAISAQELKEEFDAPAKEIVAPKVNNLIDELEDVTAAASLGAVAPTGFSGATIQALLNALGSAIKTIEASQVSATPPSGQTGDNVQTLINNINTAITNIQADVDDLNAKKHTHLNKALLDTYSQTESDLADAVSKKHTHSNKSILDKLSEDSSGNPTYDGNTIPTSGSTGGLQTFIDEDNLAPPSAAGQVGDLQFFGGLGNEVKDLYRYEDSSWVKLALTSINDGNVATPFRKFVVSNQDLGEDQPLDEDTIYIVYEE